MKSLRQYLEHRMLLPTITAREIDNILSLAQQISSAAVCLPPFWTKKAHRELNDSKVQLVTAIGYPYGYQMTETKIQEIAQALENGADELEISVNTSAFKSGMPWVKIELAKCSHLIHKSGKLMSVLVDRSFLDDHQLKTLIMICNDAGTDFINFTGPMDVKSLVDLRELVSSGVGLKIIENLQTTQQGLHLLKAGADRLCISNTLQFQPQLADL